MVYPSSSTKIDPWLVIFRPNPNARLRLFCFPFAGGSAMAYRAWPEELPAAIEVCAVQLPGRESRLREAPATSLPNLIPTLTDALSPYFTLPFAFFGHSMGALIGFELARYLRKMKRPGPVHLFYSGHRAPQLPDPDPPLHVLPEPQFVTAIRNFNGTPEAVLQHPELMQLVLPILRADFTLVETYTYQPDEPLNCPISALGGVQDKDATREELDALRQQTRRAFSLRMFAGDHFYLNDQRTALLKAVAQDLRPFL
ncbi:MAG: alpha/beta fold hydrolase [Chloroflexota bacterium]